MQKNNHQEFVAEACLKDLSTSHVLHHHFSVIFHLHGVIGVAPRLLIMLSAANDSLTGCYRCSFKIKVSVWCYLQATALVKAFISSVKTVIHSVHFVIVIFCGHKFDFFSLFNGNYVALVVSIMCQLWRIWWVLVEANNHWVCSACTHNSLFCLWSHSGWDSSSNPE